MNEKAGYPFPVDIQDKQDITEGAFAIVKEFSHHPDWIIKELDQVLDEDFRVWLYMQEKYPSAETPDMTFERFRDEVLRHQQVLAKHLELKPYMPETALVYGADDHGNEKGFIVMQKVTGEDLENMHSLDTAQLQQLEEIIHACLDFYESNKKVSDGKRPSFGYFPDIISSSLSDDGGYQLHNIMYGTLPGEPVESRRMLFIDSYPLKGVYEHNTKFFESLVNAMDTFELENGVRFGEDLRQRVRGYLEKQRETEVDKV